MSLTLDQTSSILEQMSESQDEMFYPRLDSTIRSLYQDVAVPLGATNLRLTGYINIATEETSGVWDTLTITIRNTSNSVLETLTTLSNADQNASWASFTLNAASANAGQTIRLHLESNQDSLYNTNFFCDTFALQVTVCQ